MDSISLFPNYKSDITDIIKVVSVLEPWASLIGIIKAKHIETRSWATRYRGPLAIHASKGLLPKRELTSLFQTNIEIRKAFLNHFGQDPLLMDYRRIFNSGMILATCNLVDVFQITDKNIPAEPERSFGDYTLGRFAWVLEDIKPLEKPILAKGQLGLWYFSLTR